MPEEDFAGSQVLSVPGQSQKTWNPLLVIGTTLGLYALFIAGLVIQRVSWFVAFVAAVILIAIGYQRQARIKERVSHAFRENRGLAIALFVSLLAAYPFILRGDPYLLQIAALAAIYAIMALGLNITLGYAGLLDLSFAVYFGAGAYASAQLAIHFGLSFWLGLLAGGAAGSVFGFIVAWPALRVQDHYLGLVTLGYGLMMDLLARNLNFLTNGTDGVINIPPPAIGSHVFTNPLTIGPVSLPFQANFYYLTVALALLAAFVNYRLRRSKLGRVWDAIREDEIAARCSGISAHGAKVLAFSTGAFFGGIGGSVYAHMIGFISPETFSFMESMMVLVMVVLGGAGNIMGVAFGAVLLVLLPERFREFAQYRLLLFGAALVLLMINRPEGLFPRMRIRRFVPPEKLRALKEKATLNAGSGVTHAEAR